MFRIDNDTASTTLPPIKPVGIPGYFTVGTVGGVSATIVEADFLNQVQEELMAILAAASITPSKSVNTQVIQAILWLIANNTRQRLTAPLDLYVNVATGSDTNNGLTPTTAFASPQRAYDFVMQKIDMGGNPVTVHVAAGAYNPWMCIGQPVGYQGAGVWFVGDVNQPDNVLVNAINGTAITVSQGATVSIQGFKIQANGNPDIDYHANGNGLQAADGGWIEFGQCDFGTCSNNHLQCSGYSTITSGGQPYTISGSARAHAGSGYSGANLTLADSTVTINNNPNFSVGFCWIDTGSTQSNYSMVFNGTATGPHAAVTSNGVLFIAGQNVNTYLPGSAPAVINTGGQVL